MLSAGTIWVFAAVNIVTLWLAIIVVDLYLWQSGQETISAFLRLHPGWFWVPAGIMFSIKIALALHLFVTDGPP